ncbi:MAG: isochorismate synthase, partial [Mycobacterium sp.]
MSTTDPPFVLCGPAGVLIADGTRACFDNASGAQSALRSQTVPIVLGALPFDVSGPAARMAPKSVQRRAGLPDWPTGPLPAVRVTEAIPAADEHRDRVRR